MHLHSKRQTLTEKVITSSPPVCAGFRFRGATATLLHHFFSIYKSLITAVIAAIATVIMDPSFMVIRYSIWSILCSRCSIEFFNTFSEFKRSCFVTKSPSKISEIIWTWASACSYRNGKWTGQWQGDTRPSCIFSVITWDMTFPHRSPICREQYLSRFPILVS